MTFWHLLKMEFRNRLALARSAAMAVAMVFFFLPNPSYGTLAVFAMFFLVGGLVFLLMTRTPWCSDRAFWRTRPVTPGTLWAARSLALVVLVIIPVIVVTWVSLAGMGSVTQWLGIGLFGGAALLMTGAAAAIQAIGSRGRGWAVAAVIASFLPAFSVMGILARFYQPPPSEWSHNVWAMLLTVLTVAVIAWLAWLTVGRWFRWKQALVILAVGSALCPLLIAGFDHWLYYRTTLQLISETTGREASMSWKHLKDFTALQKINEGLPVKEYPLELSEKSLLRVPLWPVGLEEGQFMVPDRLFLKGESQAEGRGIYQSQSLGSAGVDLLDGNNRCDVFSGEHRTFSAWMDLERMWETLRQQVPAHQSWIPTDAVHEDRNLWLTLPEKERFDDSDLAVHMQGHLYQFHALEPLAPAASNRVVAAPGRLDLVSATIPNPNAIDVRLFWKRPVPGQTDARHWMASSSPPELWGILFHAPSGTAYGTASLRESWRNHGPASILIHRADLVLRFELPALEIALLGLDVRQVLEESTLYLFTVEKQGRVLASLEPQVSKEDIK